MSNSVSIGKQQAYPVPPDSDDGSSFSEYGMTYREAVILNIIGHVAGSAGEQDSPYDMADSAILIADALIERLDAELPS